MRLNLNKGYGVFLTVLLLLGLLLAACSGDDSTDDAPLPTRVVVGDATAEVTADTPGDVANTPPEITEEPSAEMESTENMAPPPDDSPTPEGTQEVVSPPVDAPPNFNQQQNATADPNVPPGPPVDATSNPANAGPPGLSAEALDDFSALEAGETAMVTGILSIVDSEDAEIAVLTDSNGVTLEVNSPLAMTQPMVDQQIIMFGEVVEATGGSGAEFAITPRTISASGGTGSDLPMNSGEGSVPPVVGDNDSPVFPGSIREEEVLDLEFESDLTALQAYDALVEAIADELEGTYWYRATGSETSGWTFEFIEPDEQTLTRYTVTTDGQVMRAASTPATPLSENEDLAIDRELVVVDSDVITQQLDDDNNTPFGSPLITLAVNLDGAVQWLVNGPEPITFDATEPLDD